MVGQSSYCPSTTLISSTIYPPNPITQPQHTPKWTHTFLIHRITRPLYPYPPTLAPVLCAWTGTTAQATIITYGPPALDAHWHGTASKLRRYVSRLPLKMKSGMLTSRNSLELMIKRSKDSRPWEGSLSGIRLLLCKSTRGQLRMREISMGNQASVRFTINETSTYSVLFMIV
jgi:hypothetical protein